MNEDQMSEELTVEQQKKLDEISASITRYYDSITEEERAEISEWADIVAVSLAQTDWAEENPINRSEDE